MIVYSNSGHARVMIIVINCHKKSNVASSHHYPHLYLWYKYVIRIFAIPIVVVDIVNDHHPVEQEPTIRTMMMIISTGIPNDKCKHKYDNTVSKRMTNNYRYDLTIIIKTYQLASSPIPLILNMVFKWLVSMNH